MKKIAVLLFGLFFFVVFLILLSWVASVPAAEVKQKSGVAYLPPPLKEDLTVLAADSDQMEATLLLPEFGGMFVIFDDGDSHYFPEQELSDLVRANKHILRKENRVALNITAKIEKGEVIYFFYLSSGDPTAQYILHPPEE